MLVIGRGLPAWGFPYPIKRICLAWRALHSSCQTTERVLITVRAATSFQGALVRTYWNTPSFTRLWRNRPRSEAKLGIHNSSIGRKDGGSMLADTRGRGRDITQTSSDDHGLIRRHLQNNILVTYVFCKMTSENWGGYVYYSIGLLKKAIIGLQMRVLCCIALY